MLAIFGFATLATFMVAVMRKYATAFVAIIAAPVIFAVIAGFGPQLGDMVLSGLETVAPTAVLLLFAILYFGIMMDAKLFDPVTNLILRISKGDPVKIVVGTAVLALLVALDGDGTTSYMIICSAFIPIYRRLGLNPLIIAVIATMSLGLISGSTPWGGAATRAISVLNLDAGEYFVSLIPSLALTSLFIIGMAFVLGIRARRTVTPESIAELSAEIKARKAEGGEKPTWRTFVNAGLTVLLLVLLVADIAPLVVLFIGGFVIALLVNYPKLSTQGELIQRHAASAVPVVMLVLAAGVFTGILSESGMIEAMADTLLSVVPDSLGNLIPLFTAIIAIPLGFFMSNDAFFFGILPVLAESAGQYGVHANEIARAGVVGQISHMIGPASAPLWVLLGLLKKELGEFQRFSILWVVAGCFAFLGFQLLTGAISLA
ncbi:CitMHS family transporter [Frigoribacterium sp. RIT-PI-h]|uniref:CitMHS family transporter n=1 Tax=Frigoribacterium sp. RIT-PI-h TaxID=1690245 RepID=UPI0006B96186|nr:citrate:proton symporter [Frigoribacterium sp. RIT-PI-h]KPG82383.1 damage-inducible protein CinA [Frigoribacterium sp. RIT-PI-h]